MTIDSRAIIDATVGHALATGYFESGTYHEPKSAPGELCHYAVWAQHLRPIPLQSGLAATSARLVLNGRIYLPFLKEPQDEIDPRILDATDALMAAYTGDFTLGGLVADIDLLGRHGVPLAAEAGYLTQDQTIYRVMVLTIPCVLSDVWTQAP